MARSEWSTSIRVNKNYNDCNNTYNDNNNDNDNWNKNIIPIFYIITIICISKFFDFIILPTNS